MFFYIVAIPALFLILCMISDLVEVMTWRYW
jgi:hypothetical protein